MEWTHLIVDRPTQNNADLNSSYLITFTYSQIYFRYVSLIPLNRTDFKVNAITPHWRLLKVSKLPSKPPDKKTEKNIYGQLAHTLQHIDIQHC